MLYWKKIGYRLPPAPGYYYLNPGTKETKIEYFNGSTFGSSGINGYNLDAIKDWRWSEIPLPNPDDYKNKNVEFKTLKYTNTTGSPIVMASD